MREERVRESHARLVDDESHKYLWTTYELQSNRQTEQNTAVGIILH